MGEKAKTYGFEISQHSIDTDVMHGIRTLMGFGAVYLDKTQARARYSMTRGHYQEVIKIYNSRIKSDYKYEQFYK